MNHPPVELVALGGLGEIGLNSMALACGPDMVVIDAGLMFPDETMYGVDVVIPDFSHVLENAGKVRAIILTHGHEDHIGALPFLLHQLRVPVPVYGTRLTLELVRDRLKEHRLPDTDLRLIAPGRPLTLGPFTFDFIRVSHSIIDGVGLAIDTPAGCLIHTGDFKIEQSPLPGQEIELGRFAAYGQSGVLALLSDSTNVERPGYTLSEKKIGQTFHELFATCPGRIIVAMFASSITRIQQVIHTASDFDRKVAMSGRSMVTNVRIARDLDYLTLDKDQEIGLNEIGAYPDDRVAVITTGSQGEPMSALTRMAAGDHKQVQIRPGDTVILSSRFIPGNERAITDIINNLYRRGAEVVYETVSEIHVSGHAYQEELKLMINLTRPKYFIPIHGEYRHLVKHIELARDVGLAPERLILAEDGDLLRFEDGQCRKAGRVNVGRVLVDGKGVGDVGQAVLKDRRHLAEHGMVIVLLVIDEQTGEILSGPDLISKGFIFEEATPHFLEDAKCIVLEVFDQYFEGRDRLGEVKFDLGEIKADIQRELRRFYNQVLDRRPVILPQIITI
jgi:ribonuclease J